ncbi:MAG: molecular chaperone DnaJ [Synechococcaceae cyanobacterium]|nr:molecular chaperone DnaJ [Synechococcaceae cyanobacterium]
MSDPTTGAVQPQSATARRRRQAPAAAGQGFGAGREAQEGGAPDRRRGAPRRRRTPRLSPGDWGPLGKHPDLDAIVARQRLGLPLSGRLTLAAVNQAWKRAAAEHHPDRGGAHSTMQSINGARDLLLGRDEIEPGN